MQQLAAYDYASLDAETAAFLAQAAQRIHTRMRRTVEDTAAIGEDLLAAKDRLPHGDFMEWVRDVVGMEHNTAINMMRTAILCRQNHNFYNFAPSVVYELAAPETSEEVRAAVLAGEIAPTVKAVKQAKKDAKQGARAPQGASVDATRAPGRQGATVSEPPSTAERLFDLLMRETDAEPLTVAEMAFWLSDTDEIGDGEEIRAQAREWADILREAADAAAEMPLDD